MSTSHPFDRDSGAFGATPLPHSTSHPTPIEPAPETRVGVGRLILGLAAIVTAVVVTGSALGGDTWFPWLPQLTWVHGLFALGTVCVVLGLVGLVRQRRR